MEKVVYVEPKNWTHGTATGCYNLATDTIEIVYNDIETMNKALEHERKHRSRRNKPTFQLAILYNTPIIKHLMVLALLIFGTYGVLSMYLVPFVSIAIVYFLTFAAKIYEEKQAGASLF